MEENKDVESPDNVRSTDKPETFETPVDPLDTPELNEATRRFMYGFARCTALAANMNRGGLARVYKAILGFPFEGTNVKFKNNTEHELFVLSISTLASKAVMAQAVQSPEVMAEVEELATTAVAEAEFQKISEKSEEN